MLLMILSVFLVCGVGLPALRSLAVAKVDEPKAASKSEDKADSENEKLQGTWVVDSIEQDGKTSSGDKVKNTRWVFEGDRVSLPTKDGSKEYTFKLDATKKPKELDIETKRDGATMCIYELDKNRLKICMATKASGGVRPNEFDSAKGLLITLKKQE